MNANLSGIWHNQHGSEVELAVAADGRITGKFRSSTGLAKGAHECDLVGFASGDLVSFCADFGEFDSLTAWVGHLVVDSDEQKIETQWQMTVALPTRSSGEVWKGTWVGSDVFRPGRGSIEKKPPKLPSHPVPGWP